MSNETAAPLAPLSYCRDCKFFERKRFDWLVGIRQPQSRLCLHPQLINHSAMSGESLVAGTRQTLLKHAPYCKTQRMFNHENTCGLSGKYFEPRHPPQPKLAQQPPFRFATPQGGYQPVDSSVGTASPPGSD